MVELTWPRNSKSFDDLNEYLLRLKRGTPPPTEDSYNIFLLFLTDDSMISFQWSASGALFEVTMCLPASNEFLYIFIPATPSLVAGDISTMISEFKEYISSGLIRSATSSSSFLSLYISTLSRFKPFLLYTVFLESDTDIILISALNLDLKYS